MLKIQIPVGSTIVPAEDLISAGIEEDGSEEFLQSCTLHFEERVRTVIVKGDKQEALADSAAINRLIRTGFRISSGAKFNWGIECFGKYAQRWKACSDILRNFAES
ncbi:Uncharacterised protein [uncultured archaeon]|nr:Uncharacterised protein [uncultured archaeon]